MSAACKASRCDYLTRAFERRLLSAWNTQSDFSALELMMHEWDGEESTKGWSPRLLIVNINKYVCVYPVQSRGAMRCALNYALRCCEFSFFQQRF